MTIVDCPTGVHQVLDGDPPDLVAAQQAACDCGQSGEDVPLGAEHDAAVHDGHQESKSTVDSAALDGQHPTGAQEWPLYADVAALLDGGLPDPPAPALLRRTDGHAIFYRAQVNLLFGDPESGKTLVAQAAGTEALCAGQRVLFVDIDHNGVDATVYRFLDMGAPEGALRDPDRFRYAAPDDRTHLLAVVADAQQWRPDVAIVDSIGELLPLLRLSSNSPDDFTMAHSQVLKPLAGTGAAVIAIDHLPKNPETRASGPTGTAAKRRAVGGVSVRVTVEHQFAPGQRGSAFLTLNKDRHGGMRRHCSAEGREPAIGVFTVDSTGDRMVCKVKAPESGDAAKAAGVDEFDLAALDRMDPPPKSVSEVQDRLKWRRQRAVDALREWRNQKKDLKGGQSEDQEEST